MTFTDWKTDIETRADLIPLDSKLTRTELEIAIARNLNVVLDETGVAYYDAVIARAAKSGVKLATTGEYRPVDVAAEYVNREQNPKPEDVMWRFRAKSEKAREFFRFNLQDIEPDEPFCILGVANVKASINAMQGFGLRVALGREAEGSAA